MSEKLTAKQAAEQLLYKPEPSRMAARIRSSVVSDASARGAKCDSGCRRALSCSMNCGKMSRNEESNDW